MTHRISLRYALIVLLLLFSRDALAQKPVGVQYIFPLNGSTALSRSTNIIIRPGAQLDSKTINANEIMVSGAFSGLHNGRFVLSDDKKTMVFTPSIYFTYGERVTVKLLRGIRTLAGTAVDSFSFSFTIQTQPKWAKINMLGSGGSGDDPVWPGSFIVTDLFDPNAILSFNPTKIDQPAPGDIVIAPYWSEAPVGPDTSYLSIVGDSGNVVWMRPSRDKMINFARNPDGRFTYYDEATARYYAMDSTFAIIDSFACGAGYWTDPHDIQLLPHDHALLLSCDTENNVDLSGYAIEGNHDAAVVGAMIQEIDSLKQPIFIWRSIDSGNYKIEDMIEFPHGLDMPMIDEVHANSIQVDTDGNILLSARHLDEITKINRDSGAIVWRWGGKNNQFTLLDDSIWFSHQHDVRRIANGHITVFDNGNDRRFHDGPQVGPYSRACEYELDEQAKSARLVWQFDEGRTDTSGSMGSVQRLPDGNTLIGWGVNNVFSTFGPALTEVRPDGSVALEMYLGFPYLSYRVSWIPGILNSLRNSVPHYPSEGASEPTLSAPWPNPSVGASTAELSLPEVSSVDIGIYDVLGHEMRHVASETMAAGPHNISLDGTGLANGVYHVVLRAMGKVLVQEFILAR